MKNSLKMKQKKSLNLIKVFGRKERKFWNRTWAMRNKFGWLGFIIAIPFLIISHYAFAGMHFIMECLVYLGNRQQFKVNLVKLYT